MVINRDFTKGRINIVSDKYTLQEIISQTDAWLEAIQTVEKKHTDIRSIDLSGFDQIIFLGCGSTYYLSLSAAALMQSLTGIPCRGFPSSEIFLSPEVVFPKKGKIALCAISRSGNTTETIRAIKFFRANFDGKVIAITNVDNSQLANLGDLNLIIPGGYDKSVAQTRSFASMYVAATTLAVIASHRTDLHDAYHSIAEVGERIIHEYNPLAQRYGEDHDIRQLFFLGSGVNYGLACESSLKAKEMSLTVSEPFHFMEFRHGPISMVDDHTLVIGLLSDDKIHHENAVIQDTINLGAKVLTLNEENAIINFSSHLPQTLRGVLYLPVLQLMAYYRAKSFGLDPDHPRNLSAVVELKY